MINYRIFRNSLIKIIDIYDTVGADLKNVKNVKEVVAAGKTPLAAGGGLSTSTTPTRTKSFQDSMKGFSNGFKKILSLSPVYFPPTSTVTTFVPILNLHTVKTQLQPPPPSSSSTFPQILKKVFATLIQKE